MLNRIGIYQLVFILYLSRIFTILTYNLSSSDRLDGTSVMLAVVISTIMQIIVLIPALILYKKNKSQDIITTSYSLLGKPGGTVVGITYYVILIFIALSSVVNCIFFLDNAIYSDSNSILLPLIFILVCGYAAYAGIEAISRSGSIIFAIFVIALAIMFVLLSKYIDLFNIHISVNSIVKDTITATWVSFAKNVELVALILLLPKVKGKVSNGLITFFLISLITIEVVIFFLITVLGPFGKNLVFPFYTLVTISDAAVFEHLDVIHMSIWVFVSFIKTSLYLYLAIRVFKAIFPKAISKLAWLISVSIIWVAMLLIRYNIVAVNSVSKIIDSGVIIILLVLIIPSILLLALSLKKEKSYAKIKDNDIAVDSYI